LIGHRYAKPGSRCTYSPTRHHCQRADLLYKPRAYIVKAPILMRSFRSSWRSAVNTCPSRTALAHPRALRRELHSRPTTLTLYPARPTALVDHTPCRTLTPKPYTPLVTRRYCSHRRNMCRHFGGEEHGSATIAGVREVLPTNVKPMHYHLTLEPNFNDFTYEGTVVIEYAIALYWSSTER
jgi:hypothetical protein